MILKNQDFKITRLTKQYYPATLFDRKWESGKRVSVPKKSAKKLDFQIPLFSCSQPFEPLFIFY